MNVFEAFPNAIEAWNIGRMAYGTVTGNTITDTENLDAIVSEVSSSELASANMAEIDSDTLLYVKPEQLPTTSTAELISSYAVKDPDGRLYAIRDAGAGKNQDDGTLEHIELLVRQIAGQDGEEPDEPNDNS